MEPANNLVTQFSPKQVAEQRARAASAELNRARVVEWATSFTLGRFLANRTRQPTPFDYAMTSQTYTGRYFSVRRH